MTRIVAGSVGGRVIEVPAHGTRPTSERVREAIFSRLEHTGAVEGARVLDLYAGSGALGIEALSRGAASATLVDSGRHAAEAGRRNARALGLGTVRVAQQPAERFTREAPSQGWDLVFLDPPYDVGEAELATVLAQLVGGLAAGATVVVERSARSPEPSWPAGLERVATKTYGETVVHYAAPADEAFPGSDREGHPAAEGSGASGA